MIDAHNHLDFDAFDADRSRVVEDARRQGVTSWVLAGTHPATWARTSAIAAATDGVAVLGVHPAEAARIADWDAVIDQLRASACAGIGEIGLDRRAGPLESQMPGLRVQLALARDLGRPVVFHCVGAYPEFLAIIRRDGLPAPGGVVHGWSGPPDRVDEALELGLSISFGPAITRSNAPRQIASARRTPLDRLLIETDAPDQPIAGHDRGSPADLARVADAVAEARDVDVATIASATRHNTARLFGLGNPT